MLIEIIYRTMYCVRIYWYAFVRVSDVEILTGFIARDPMLYQPSVCHDFVSF